MDDINDYRRIRATLAAEALDMIGTDRYDIARLTGLTPGEIVLMLSNRDRALEIEREQVKFLKKENVHLLRRNEQLEHELDMARRKLVSAH